MRTHTKNEVVVNSTGLNNPNALRNSEYLRNVAYGGNKTGDGANQTSQKQIAKSTQNLK